MHCRSSTATDKSHTCDLDDAVGKIAREKCTRDLDAIRALWRIGDIVNSLRATVAHGSWRATLALCAARVGVHPKSLDEAARAATAFPASKRDDLIRGFVATGRSVQPSHIVALARVSPARRARGLEALRSSALSVRELRSFLRMS